MSEKVVWLHAPLSPDVECWVEMNKRPSREEVLALIAYLQVYLAETDPPPKGWTPPPGEP